MSYLLESQLEFTVDIPVSLGATHLRMGDWLVVAALNLEYPASLTWNFCNLQILESSVDISKINSGNYIYGNLGLVYLVLRKDYSGGSPGVTGALDTLVATSKGIFSRERSRRLVLTQPGSYSWIIANNMQPSAAPNAQIPLTESLDFVVAVTGAVRYTLWPKNNP